MTVMIEQYEEKIEKLTEALRYAKAQLEDLVDNNVDVEKALEVVKGALGEK